MLLEGSQLAADDIVAGNLGRHLGEPHFAKERKTSVEYKKEAPSSMVGRNQLSREVVEDSSALGHKKMHASESTLGEEILPPSGSVTCGPAKLTMEETPANVSTPEKETSLPSGSETHGSTAGHR